MCTDWNSGVFRGRATVRCPPFGHTMKIFYRRLYMKRRGFLLFSSKHCKIQQCLMVFCVSKFQKNGRICGYHRSKKCFSFRGASPPSLPNQGLCPWTPATGLECKCACFVELYFFSRECTKWSIGLFVYIWSRFLHSSLCNISLFIYMATSWI